MTAKAKERNEGELTLDKNVQISETPILYDATAEQNIPLEIAKGTKVFRVSHNLKPLSDDRFFQLEDEVQLSIKRLKKLSTEIFSPRHELWKELAIKREGYTEREDWLDSTKEADAVQAINALLHAEVVPATDEESGLLDDEAETPIVFRAMFSGALVELTHFFREETKAEKDRYFSITANEPDSNALASAVKKSKTQRLYELGISMVKRTEGYANGQIPAWHIAKTTEAYFDQVVFARLGKSPNS